MRGWTRWLAAACAIFACGQATAKASATGTVRFEGVEWQAADALAYLKGEGKEATTMVVACSMPFDREEFSRDRVIDGDDIEWFLRINASAQCLEVEIPAAKGDDWSVRFMKSSTSHGYGGAAQALRVSGGKAPRVTGKVQQDGDNSATLEFDVAIEGEVKAAVEYLPDDGGEPGKALTEFFEARGKDQYARMARLLHPERNTLLEREHPTKSRFLAGAQRGTQCRNFLGFTGGNIFRDESLLGYACAYGNEEGRELRGVAVLVRDAAAWKVVGFLTEQIYE